MRETRVRISVITPTHNRRDSLLRLLRALAAGTFPPDEFEVIVVADGCSDDTVQQARSQMLPFQLTLLEQNPGRGAASARNRGAREATGELLVFLDDDIEPTADLLAEHWAAFAENTLPTAVVGPPLPVRTPNANFDAIAAWAWWEQQFARMSSPGHRFTYDNCFSGNLSLPRALFSTIGGFDVEFNNCRDDSELGMRVLRAGGRIAFAPRARAWHHELRDTRALIRRKSAEGIADVRLARMYPELWPSMYLGHAEPRAMSAFGMVQSVAFTAPLLGAAIAAILQRTLGVLEFLRMRGLWRRVQGGLMYYWYWRGVARALRDRNTLAALRRECVAVMPPEPMQVDLANGVAAALDAVTAAAPAAITLRWGAFIVGNMAATPGAQPLGAHHVLRALTSTFSEAFKNAIAAATCAGQPVLRAAGVSISVVIPAYNACDTLGDALDSLLRQTHSEWEAIIVDDGSADATAEIAARYAARDPRIRVLKQQHTGQGAARNFGLSAARYDWVLFLDADDWLWPTALQALGRTALGSNSADVIHGGWSRATVDGSTTPVQYGPDSSDLFPLFARYCALRIHSALVRRTAIATDTPFDTSLKACVDWDFWQRIARSGARFVRIPDAVACYRMRTNSSSMDVANLWSGGLQVIARGHTADSRVAVSALVHGAPADGLRRARYEYACWVAGIAIGQQRDPRKLLDELQGEPYQQLDPEIVALQLHDTIPLAKGQSTAAWDALWDSVIGRVAEFLATLEHVSGAPDIARRSMRALESLTIDSSATAPPFVRGSTLVLSVDIAQPLTLSEAERAVENAHIMITAEGERIGSVRVRLGSNAAENVEALADAISQAHASPILGWFFRGTVYRELYFARSPRGIAVLRDDVTLATELIDADVVDSGKLHDKIGWTVFLQELWGRPRWQRERFYEIADDERGSREVRAEGPSVTIEASGELPVVLAENESQIDVDVRVGGAPVGVVRLQSREGRIGPSQLRAAITTQAGEELCRLAVREGVLGRPRTTRETLEQRLRARAADTRNRYAPSSRRLFITRPAAQAENDHLATLAGERDA